MTKKLKRVFHHHDKWEDAAHGMWRRNSSGDERQAFLSKARALMIDTAAFFGAMERVTYEWPYSCEANFTAPGVNKLAWLGHAGCCLATGSSEDVTRQAWHTLNQEQQDAANAAAQLAIDGWETRYVRRLQDA